MLIPKESLSALGVCFTFIGPAGAGKTTLAGSNCLSERYGGRTLVLDAEGGAKVIADDPGIEIASITRWAQLDRVTSEFVQGKYPEFKGVILDNLIEYQKLNLAHLVGPTGTPEFKEWNQDSQDMRHLIRRWRDLARVRDINVFFIGWDVEEKDSNGVRSKRTIQFTPALQQEFPGIVDSIGIVTAIDNDPEHRVVDFTPSTRTIAKFRRGKSEAARKLPYKIRYGLDNLPIPDILAVMKGGGSWPAAKYPSEQPRQSR